MMGAFPITALTLDPGRWFNGGILFSLTSLFFPSITIENTGTVWAVRPSSWNLLLPCFLPFYPTDTPLSACLLLQAPGTSSYIPSLQLFREVNTQKERVTNHCGLLYLNYPVLDVEVLKMSRGHFLWNISVRGCCIADRVWIEVQV